MRVCGPVAVNLHAVGQETRCRLPTCWFFLVLLLLQPVFSMADACSVANDSPLAHDRVVETMFEQGSPQVGVVIPPCTRRHKVV